MVGGVGVVRDVRGVGFMIGVVFDAGFNGLDGSDVDDEGDDLGENGGKKGSEKGMNS